VMSEVRKWGGRSLGLSKGVVLSIYSSPTKLTITVQVDG
jgi:hypothetical protein